MPSTTTVVTSIPACNLCGSPAYADANIPGDRWGYVCKTCFDGHGCSLGLGRGQVLLLELPSANALAPTVGDMVTDRWMRAVDTAMAHFVGCTRADLEDFGITYDFDADFAAGMSPGVSAAKAIAAANKAGF